MRMQQNRFCWQYPSLDQTILYEQLETSYLDALTEKELEAELTNAWHGPREAECAE